MDVWSIVSPTCSVMHLKSTQYAESELCTVIGLVGCKAFCEQKITVEKEESEDIPSKNCVSKTRVGKLTGALCKHKCS